MPAAPELNNLTGKVAIVTGGNQGIGYWTVYHLSKAGAKVYLAARSKERAMGAIASIKNLPGAVGPIKFLHLELEDPKGVKAVAEAFSANEQRLDIIIHNAGLQSSDHDITREGLQRAMVINHFSPFVFTRTLDPLLEKTSKLAGSDVRVVTVTSIIHSQPGKEINFDSVENFNISYEGKSMAHLKRYAVTKLAGLLWGRELQSQYDARGLKITSISVHPGGVWTDTSEKFVKSLPMGSALAFVASKLTMSPEQGAYTSLFAAASPKVAADFARYRGSYLVPYDKVTKPTGRGDDAALQKTLWASTERILAQLYGL